MKVLRDFGIDFDENELILSMGGQLGKELNPRMKEATLRLLEEAMGLIQPQGIYDVVSVTKSEGKRIYIGEDTYFESGIVMKFMGKAERLALCVYTIGKALEDRSVWYMQNSQYLDGTLLDGIGTVLLSNTGIKVYDAIKEEAARLGLEASVPASPGQIDWVLRQQRIIFGHLNASDIGVSLTPSCLMIPKKTVSMVVGFGHDVVKRGEGSSCDYCPLKDTCPSRRVGDYRLLKASK